LLSSPAAGELPLEEIGRVEYLPRATSPHWIWASDAIHRRITLVDVDTQKLLGVIDGGWGLTVGLFPAHGREIYVPETHYSRGNRGERTDVVTFYDAISLAPTGEVEIPPKRAINALATGNAAVSDDGRFIAIFNMNPATSLSIVDAEKRVFVGEIATPGCSLAYGAGDRRFAMLCSNGSMLVVRLDDTGRELAKVRSEPFFDPQADPVTEKAARYRDRWVFASFEGLIHEADFSGPEVHFAAPWSLFDEADRAASWRIGGAQHLAIHEASGRLYALVHQGGVDTHKEGGTELWVYDLDKRERLDRVELHSPGFTYLGVPMEFGQSWIWPFNRLYGWLVDASLSYVGVGNVTVTQGENPLLITGSNFSGSLAIYDALSGEFLDRVTTGNMTTLVLQSPWRPTREAP
jgi:methylamine dehydrogenase heavy chain